MDDRSRNFEIQTSFAILFRRNPIPAELDFPFMGQEPPIWYCLLISIRTYVGMYETVSLFVKDIAGLAIYFNRIDLSNNTLESSADIENEDGSTIRATACRLSDQS